jgi:hypothetical protein
VLLRLRTHVIVYTCELQCICSVQLCCLCMGLPVVVAAMTPSPSSRIKSVFTQHARPCSSFAVRAQLVIMCMASARSTFLCPPVRRHTGGQSICAFMSSNSCSYVLWAVITCSIASILRVRQVGNEDHRYRMYTRPFDGPDRYRYCCAIGLLHSAIMIGIRKSASTTASLVSVVVRCEGYG